MAEGFSAATYNNLISQQSETQRRLFSEYTGDELDFDVVIVGSGMGGGILADDLADSNKKLRILVIEAGSYLFPTHVYNVSRFPNSDFARKYGVQTFSQPGQNDKSEFYIGEQLQLNLGGRSIFWSGLIPAVQPWEFQFFPENVRSRLATGLAEAETKLNASVTLGQTARDIVEALQNSDLAKDFVIAETPRALHQPYLKPSGAPATEFLAESTGVFNTAELLINQIGLKPEDENLANSNRFQLLLNHYVESVKRQPEGDRYDVHANDVLGKRRRLFTASAVVLAAGSLESPKIVHRSSSVFNSLPPETQKVVGLGLTDHPTTSWIQGAVTSINNKDIPRTATAKIIFYSRGLRDEHRAIRYPFNIEMNVNHEYWHLRENDPSSPQVAVGAGSSTVEIKFSFGNLLDDENVIDLNSGYVPNVSFKNLNRTEYLKNRFNALARWNKTVPEIFEVLNGRIKMIFSQFRNGNDPAQPEGYLREDGPGFGYGTVHHAVGTLRMPATKIVDSDDFSAASVVDEDLKVLGQPGLYVCDMSVLPYSSAANPVRTLAALSLQLSRHLQGQ